MLRVGQGGALLDGVIIDLERGGAALLVAIACRGRLAGVSNGARSATTSYRCAPPPPPPARPDHTTGGSNASCAARQ